MEYRTFRNEISNLRSYYEAKCQTEDEIDLLWYELTGVKGVSFDRQPTSFNPSLSEQTRLELLDKIEQKEKELDYLWMAIERYEKNLNRLSDEVRGYVEQLFILGETFETVGKRTGYNKGSIAYKIRSEVEKL